MKPKDLRDEFALAVVNRVAVDTINDYNNGHELLRDGEPCSPAEFTAWVCYSIAEAMMAEREKTNATD